MRRVLRPGIRGRPTNKHALEDVVTRPEGGAPAGGGRVPPTHRLRTRSRRQLLGIAAGTLGSLGLLAACSRAGAGAVPHDPSATTSTEVSASTTTDAAGTVIPTTYITAAGTSASPRSVAPAILPHSRPNVILVTIDTLRADQIGVFGQRLVKTPTLDAFAAEGARFAWHMVHQPQTIPSHASILTGMYPTSDGVRIQMVDTLSSTLDTAATAFGRQGYTTAALFSCPVFEPQHCGFQRGFDVYTDLTQGIIAHPPGELLKSPAARTTDAAIAQLRAFGNQPFFLWLHYIDPHCPYIPPAPFASRYDPSYQGTFNGGWTTVVGILAGKLHLKSAELHHLKTLYQDEISYVDNEIGRFFTAIDQLGHRENTVVAVTADHGESFAEHRDFFVGEGIYHPRSLYNTELHVPLFLRHPPRIRPGTLVTTPTRAIDILPTLLDLADVPPLPQVQGLSLLSLLEGKETEARTVFSAMASSIFTSVTVPGWKLILNNASHQQHLFDLTHDPAEMHDVQQTNPEVVTSLSTQLGAWMQAQGVTWPQT